MGHLALAASDKHLRCSGVTYTSFASDKLRFVKGRVAGMLRSVVEETAPRFQVQYLKKIYPRCVFNIKIKPTNKSKTAYILYTYLELLIIYFGYEKLILILFYRQGEAIQRVFCLNASP